LSSYTSVVASPPPPPHPHHHSLPTRRSSDLVARAEHSEAEPAQDQHRAPLAVHIRGPVAELAIAVPPPTVRRAGARHAAGVTASDRKSTRLNSSHGSISYAVFCLKKKIRINQ